MEFQNMQQLLDSIDTQMLELNDTVIQLRALVGAMTEENNRLRIQNNELTQLLKTQNMAVQVETLEGPMELAKSNKGLQRLQGFYDEGIHICQDYFGSSRSTHEECMFCLTILDRLE